MKKINELYDITKIVKKPIVEQINDIKISKDEKILLFTSNKITDDPLDPLPYSEVIGVIGKERLLEFLDQNDEVCFEIIQTTFVKIKKVM